MIHIQIIISFVFQLDDEGHCIWYGQCGKDEATGKPLNCVYNGPAKELNDTRAIDVLAELCPQYVTSKSEFKIFHYLHNVILLLVEGLSLTLIEAKS